MRGIRPIVPVSSPSPQRRPIRYPTESPITAPDTAATMTAQSGTVPRDATTPPRMTAISPGNTNPTNADASSAGNKKTSDSANHPGSSKILSVRPAITPLAVVTAGHHPPSTPWPSPPALSGQGQRLATGPLVTGGAIAAAKPGLITVLISASRSSKGAKALFIALIVSHWMSDQP